MTLLTLPPAERLASRVDTVRGRSDSQAQAIVAEVLEGIETGVLQPGDRLPDERSLCQRYAAGRHTVRKAMDMLERQGRVGRFVGRGSFVLDPQPPGETPSDQVSPAAANWSLFELTEARLLFEPALAALAVERATPDDLAELERCRDTLALTDSWRDFKEAKYAFHRCIAQIARNGFFCAMFDQLVASRRQAWAGYHPRPQHLAAALQLCLEECDATLAAFRRDDAEAAAETVRRSVNRILLSIGGT